MVPSDLLQELAQMPLPESGEVFTDICHKMAPYTFYNPRKTPSSRMFTLEDNYIFTVVLCKHCYKFHMYKVGPLGLHFVGTRDGSFFVMKGHLGLGRILSNVTGSQPTT